MDDGELERFLRLTFRSAGRQVEEARRAFDEARTESAPDSDADRTVTLPDLPENANGNARIVCRRHAEKRALALDDAGRPPCFDADHVDCQGCVEDIRDGTVETW
jgi:hypothetical protein